MSIESSPKSVRAEPRQAENTYVRRSAMALAVAGALMTVERPAFAEETVDVKALQEEVARLKKALEKSEKALAAQQSANVKAAGAAPAATAGGSAPAAASAGEQPAAGAALTPVQTPAPAAAGAPPGAGAAAVASTAAGTGAAATGAAAGAAGSAVAPASKGASGVKAAKKGKGSKGAAAVAQAEPKALNEVVARSRRTLRAKHDEAESVSVVTGAQMEQTGAYSLADISRRTANLSRDTGNPRTLALSIRGIGRKAITEAQDPVVLTSIDGISYAYNSLATWDQVDIDDIEVFRGPGGTMGGKNYSLGAVNIFTRRPSFTSGGRYAMRFGEYDTFYGDLAYGGPIVDKLLAWRGTFFVHKADGAFDNFYPGPHRTYIDTDQISGKVQLLLTPREDLSARLEVDVQPRTYQNFNGFNFYHHEPITYTNGNGWNPAATPFNRLGRGALQQLTNYSLEGNQYNFYNFKTGSFGNQYNDAQMPLGTKMQGGLGEVNWKVGGFTVTSLTGYRQFWFDANNDEGTPYDITLQSGGGVNYRQFSQELKLASAKGEWVDYVTGLYYIKTATNVDAKNGWGSDAGYWFVGGTPNLYTDPYGGTQISGVITGPAYTHNQLDPFTNKQNLVYGGAYGRLTTDAAGRYLLEDSLNGMRVLGEQRIRNQSPAWYGTANWHPFEDFTLTTGLRTTYEDRTTSAYRYVTNNGTGGILNPTLNSFGVNMGGFDSVFVSAPTALTGGGYNARNANGQWQSFNYNTTFNAATDTNTYVVNNKIVSQSAWKAAGKPHTATSYATNDSFYTNGAKLGLGTDVSKAFTMPKVGTTNATKAVMPTSNVIRVQVNTAALTTQQSNFKAALNQANAAAYKYFGKRTVTTNGVTTQAWDQLTAAQQRQITDAQALRKGQIGVIYNSMTAQPFRAVQLTSVVSPMYKINDNFNAYATWQRGESAGIAQIVNGVSMQAKPQTTNAFEVGLKSFLFEKTLTLNTDFFFMDMKNYQQAVQVVDEYTTAVINDGNLYYTSATLNADDVRAWGFEFDAAYTGIPDTTLRLAGAYNDAWYEKFPNAPLPPEIDPNSPQYKNSPYRDLSGYTLPGASRFMFNMGGEYRHILPYFDGFEGHTAFNYAFQTGYNADVTLSQYGWVNGFGLLDFTVGIGLKNRMLDLSLLARNILDTTPVAPNAATGVMQTVPRFLGVVISGQF